MTNILIIGNGFDLAHNLPTKYSDYLNQLNNQSEFYGYIKLEKDRLIDSLDKLIDGEVCNYLFEKKKKIKVGLILKVN